MKIHEDSQLSIFWRVTIEACGCVWKWAMPRRYPDNAIGNPGDWGVQKWGPRTRRKAWFPASTSPKIVIIIPLTEMVKPPLTEFQWWTCFLFYSLLVFWSCGMAHGTPITLYNCQSLAISDISIMSTALWVNIQKIWTKKNIEKRPAPRPNCLGNPWPPMESRGFPARGPG